jgi:hypothetical protein
VWANQIILPNGPQYMPPGPVSQDPGRDEDPRLVPPWPEWMDDPTYLALRADDEDPADGGLDLDGTLRTRRRGTWIPRSWPPRRSG